MERRSGAVHWRVSWQSGFLDHPEFDDRHGISLVGQFPIDRDLCQAKLTLYRCDCRWCGGSVVYMILEVQTALDLNETLDLTLSSRSLC